jgi:hypothetical protein
MLGEVQWDYDINQIKLKLKFVVVILTIKLTVQ